MNALSFKYSINKFYRGLPGKDLFLDWLFASSIEVVGLQSGRTGPSVESVFSKEAHAKLVIRLQPNQDPQDIA